MGQNALRSLDARLLAGLPSLRRLDLSENRLASLQGSPFSPAPLLEHVNLSNNALQALPAAALGPLRALYELDLAHNRLNALPMHPGRALDGYVNIFFYLCTMNTYNYNAVLDINCFAFFPRNYNFYFYTQNKSENKNICWNL